MGHYDIAGVPRCYNMGLKTLSSHTHTHRHSLSFSLSHTEILSHPPTHLPTHICIHINHTDHYYVKQHCLILGESAAVFTDTNILKNKNGTKSEPGKQNPLSQSQRCTFFHISISFLNHLFKNRNV